VKQRVSSQRQARDAGDRTGTAAALLVPLSWPPGGAALQYKIVVDNFQEIEHFRAHTVGAEDNTRAWLRELNSILRGPTLVAALQISAGSEARDAHGPIAARSA
jgi:hypothetical protein